MTKLYINYSDIPSDEPCWMVNTKLWNEFCYAYELQEGRFPEQQWTEAEVTQWLDLYCDDVVESDIYI
jgi:hypothetical protein